MKIIGIVVGILLYFGLIFWYKYYQYEFKKKKKLLEQQKIVGKGYRIPSAEEFIQGFEFEVKKEYAFGFMFFHEDGTSTIHKGEPYFEWQPRKVNWKRTEWYSHTDSQGRTISMDADTHNFLAEPFDVISFLKQGLIRVKI